MKVVYKRSFERDFERLPEIVRPRIDRAITRLSKNPFLGDIKKLKGEALYRIRIGDYRILFSLDNEQKTLILEAVKHRREAYR